MNAVTSWSYSAYALYTECPFKYKCIKIDKLPDPAGPALLKGRQVHISVENFLKQPTTAFPVAAGRFSELLYALVEAPKLLVEQKWAFQRNWREAPYYGKRDGTGPQPWLRSVIDAGVIYDDNVVELIDWKTGKMYDVNADQMELFALSGMVRYAETPLVITRLAYLDSGDEIIVEHKASDREALKAKWEQKVVPMFTDTVFAPRPNDNCKWCNFSRSKGGPCRFG